jgi:hypothetical protein
MGGGTLDAHRSATVSKLHLSRSHDVTNFGVPAPRSIHRVAIEPCQVIGIVAASLGIVAILGLARATPTEVFIGDIAEFQTLGITGGLAHANGYSLYITVANLFALLPLGPLADAAYRINLLSTVFGGLTVGLLTFFVARVANSVVAGVFAGLAFFLLEPMWAVATVAQPYTFDTTMTLVVLLFLTKWAYGSTETANQELTASSSVTSWLRQAAASLTSSEGTSASGWPLYVAMFTWGASFGIHNATILLAPAVAMLTVFTFPWRSDFRRGTSLFAKASIAFVLGVVVYVATWFFQDSRNVPHDFMRILGWIAPNTWIPSLDTPLKRFWFEASNQQWRPAFFALPVRSVGGNVLRYLLELVTLFSIPGLVLVGLGGVDMLMRRPRLALALGLWFGAHLGFWLTFGIADLQRHLLPGYMLLATWCGVGVSVLVRFLTSHPVDFWNRTRQRFSPVVRLALIGSLAWLVLLPGARNAWLVMRGDCLIDRAMYGHAPMILDEPETYARQAVSDLPVNSVVFTNWRHHFTLVYAALFQDGRKDILFTLLDHYARSTAMGSYASLHRSLYVVEAPRSYPDRLQLKPVIE